MKSFIVFDIETDGLYDEVSKFYCLSYQEIQNKEVVNKKTVTTKQEIIELFSKDAYFIGHNIIRYDIPVLNKLFNTQFKPEVIDTLGLSWYLFPYKKLHGLEEWGNNLGIVKPKIEDWENLSLDIYKHRCEQDVEINVKLFRYLFNYLHLIYEDFNSMIRTTNYCNFKLDCLLEQELAGISLDENNTKKYFLDLEKQLDEKTNKLASVMPNYLGKIIKTQPKKMYKKDGNLSSHGLKWVVATSKAGLNINVDAIREEPNPGSTPQLKKWLVSLGWKPQTFKATSIKKPSDPKKLVELLEKLKEQEEKGLIQNVEIHSDKITKENAQISLPFGGGICESVKDLYDVEPDLIEIENYFVIKHRLGIFTGYLECVKNGKLVAKAHGFTNTMRFTHSKPIVNLPKPGTFYGKEVRGVLTIPNDDYIMCGSDVSSLEDNTKQHYIYYHDPKYVEEMRVPGFCPHIDIGILAGLMNKEDGEFYKWYDNLSREEKFNQPQEYKDRFHHLKEQRSDSKTVNFSATYGAGPPKMAKTLKRDLEFAINLHSTYWERNKAVKQIAKDCITKYVEYDGFKQKWLFNPVSKLWMLLKDDKDRFSTLNQSTGVYVFDLWVRKVRSYLKPLGIPIILQYHDEILLVCKKELQGTVDEILHRSMKEVNQLLKLNIDISISTDWGNSYTECH